MNRILGLVASALLATTVLAGPSMAQDNSAITIAVVPKVAVPFFDDVNTGASEEAEELGVQYQWVVPQNTQGSTQVRIMEDLIARNVTGIAISVNEPRSVEGVIRQAMDAGIKVLTFDSDSANSGRSMYIGTVNEEAGYTMGKALGEALGGEGQVAIITGQLGASNLNERIAGAERALAEFPGITVVAKEGTDDDLARAVSVTEAVLRANPELKGILGVSQVGGPAAASVLSGQEFADRKAGLTTFAFDDLPDTLAGVRDGTIKGIMVQRPVTMGRLSVENLVNQINETGDAPADIDTGVTIVDASNLDSYTK